MSAVDPRLLSFSSSSSAGDGFDEDQILRLMIVGLWCVHPDPDSRPSMRQVIRILDFEAHIPDHLPRERPVPTFLPRSDMRVTSSESSTVSDLSLKEVLTFPR